MTDASQRCQPLAISTGDPGGVGPDVALRAATEACARDRAVLFGDAVALRERARSLGIDPARLHMLDAGQIWALPEGGLGLCDTGSVWGIEARQHRPTAAGGHAQLAALSAATEAALQGKARALVTAPMSKAAVNLAGHDFTGHTEHLARAAGLRDDDVTMMFLGPKLRVALATTHLALAALPSALTLARVLRAVLHMGEAASRLRPPDGQRPRVLVAGLNPHAGEGGLFGEEELRVIAPAVAQARERPPFRDEAIGLDGPLGAETAFRTAAGQADLSVVAMFHDQATIASKLLDWTQAVNVTWGLPFVRTSVDHGVAYDAAASGHADARGMLSAIRLAQQLSSG